MDHFERELRVALWSIRGISSRRIDAAVEAFGSVAAAVAAPREALAEAMGLAPGAAARLAAAPEELAAWARSQHELAIGRGGRPLLRGDADFPDLGTLADPPEVLWCRGELGGAGRIGADGAPEAAAIVGARKADLAAIGLARSFAASLASGGITVVSGGAFGVDGAAHDGALAAGGTTVAVLGSGVLRPTPARHRRLFSRMLAAGGALVSELPPLEGARAEHFPRRNRLIAALSKAVVVVRAAAGSGSLYTARAMQALGRPVYVVPAPGLGAASAGGEALLAEGAIPVRSPEELLALWKGAPAAGNGADDSEEGRILLAVGVLPASVAEIAERTALSPSTVVRALTSLCLSGKVRSSGPGRFVRSR